MSKNNELTDYQKILHTLTDEERKKGMQMLAPFFRRSVKSSHYTQKTLLLESNIKENDSTKKVLTAEYHIETYPHQGFSKTFLYQVLPRIRTIDQRYEVRWKDDLLLRVIKCVKVFFENGIFNEYPSSYFYFHTESCVDSSTRKDIKWSIGNRDSLRDWSDELLPASLHYILPIFYSKSPSCYFPLYLCGKLNKSKHVIDYDLSLKNLLEISEVIVDQGVKSRKIIPFNKNLIIISDSERSPNTDRECNLEKPLMYGRYLNFTEREVEANRCNASDESCSRFYYDKVMVFEKIADTNQVSINFDKICAHTLFWHAHVIDDDGISFNNSLIESSSLIRTGAITEKKFDYPAYFTEKIIPQMHFYNVPEKQGMHMWTNQDFVGDDVIPPSISLDGFRLDINLNKDITRNSQVKIQLIVLDTSHYQFKNYPVTEKDRDNIISTMEIRE
jgi:hypothetical protein